MAFASYFASKVRGPHWALAAEEIASLAQAIAGVAVHIPLPEKELAVGVAISQLGLVAGGIFWPRIQADMEIAGLRQQQAAVNAAEQVMAEARARDENEVRPPFGFGE